MKELTLLEWSTILNLYKKHQRETPIGEKYIEKHKTTQTTIDKIQNIMINKQKEIQKESINKLSQALNGISELVRKETTISKAINKLPEYKNAPKPPIKKLMYNIKIDDTSVPHKYAHKYTSERVPNRKEILEIGHEYYKVKEVQTNNKTKEVRVIVENIS